MIKTTFTNLNLLGQTKIPGLGITNNHPGTFRVTDYRDGSYDVKWKSKIKGGENATTPLIAYITRCNYVPGSCSYTFSGYKGCTDTDMGLNAYIPSLIAYGGGVNGFRQPDAILISEAQAIARRQAFQRIHNLQGNFQGQVFLGELRETVNFLKSPFLASVKLLEKSRKLANGFAKIQKNGLAAHKLSDFGKAAGDSWLEFHFGILPLISDIKSIIELIQDKQSPAKLSYRTYGKSNKANVGPTVIGSENHYFNTVMTYTDTAECIIHFGIFSERIHRAELASDRLFDVLSKLSDVPSTAWELTPWSFLIDYFVNVGSIIDATTTGTQKVSYSSESNIYTQDFNFATLSINRAGAAYITDNSISHNRSMSFKHRSAARVGGSLAIPPLVVTLPGSSTRYANIAALLTKFLK